MFSIEEFQVEYDAATTVEDKFIVLQKGIAEYAKAIAVATAEFMDYVDSGNYGEAAVASSEMAESLGAMSGGLALIHLLKSIREGS